jgi:hypothetical protein
MQTKLFLAIVLFINILTSNIFSQEDKNAVDPKEIISKYITAIGGEENLKNVKDRTTIMRGSAMEQTITLIIKQKLQINSDRKLKLLEWIK